MKKHYMSFLRELVDGGKGDKIYNLFTLMLIWL